MFKILITSMHAYIGSTVTCSVHTVVVEFSTKADADLAIKRINENKERVVDRQKAVPLF